MKHEPRPVIHMDKQLGWAHKLGGAEALGISKVGQTVLVRLMESHALHQLAGSVGGRFRKGIRHLLASIPDSSLSPSMPLVPM